MAIPIFMSRMITGRNNLYRNDRDEFGNVHFTDVAAEAGVEDISAGMSASWGDADGDGDRDLYVSKHVVQRRATAFAYQRNFQTLNRRHRPRGISASRPGEFPSFLTMAMAPFEMSVKKPESPWGRWAWGSRFVDLNNDSREDIIVSNGFLTQADNDDL